jgi:methyltransferase family protein
MLADILVSRVVPFDQRLLRAEALVPHRVPERRFLLNYIPDSSVGAEIGVFTGLFSSLLAKQAKILHVTFVDPWWKAFGDTYPDWGRYTDHGRVSTRNAYEIAKKRVLRPGLRNRIVDVAFSYDWLESQPDESLDWVYLDSTHTYEGTKRELELLSRKLRENGVLLGDDWQPDRHHRHHGVALAVSEFLKTSDFEPVLCGVAGQWVLRRRLKRNADLPILWADAAYKPAA